MTRNWIIIHGNLINTTTHTTGFEFFGPYTEEEAHKIKDMMEHPEVTTIAVQLLRLPNHERKIKQKATPGMGG